MASLNIDFSYDDNVKRSINSAKSSLSTRISDYTGIKRNLNNMSSSAGNLTTANTYIQKKINSLQSKYNKLENFRSAVTTFNTNAEAADRRVANRINKETNQFYKREGIQTGILYAIGSVIGKGCEWLKGKIEDKFTAFVEWCKTTWENVKQWYNDNKYWIDVVVDVVCVVAAAVSLIATVLTGGGALAILVGTWALLKAGADLVYDSAAYTAYQDGDMERYKELSSKGMKDFLTENLGDFGYFLYFGMEAVSFVYSIKEIGSKLLSKDWGTAINKATGWGGAKGTWISYTTNTNYTNVAKFFSKAKIVTADVKFIIKGASNILGSDSIPKGVLKSIKITNYGMNAWNAGAELINNVFTQKAFPATSNSGLALA